LYSKLKRISASLLLSGTKKPSPFVKPDFPRYARLLALRQESSELIHHITIPVITSAAKAMRTLDEKSREAL
ncbi:nucleotidyltransferase family protein, partial [Staphylococcus aureus]